MPNPLEELRARIAELNADLLFVATAFQLRPRLAEILDWGRSKEIAVLAQRFMDVKDARPEGVFGPLLVRLMASFERYLRLLIGESVDFRVTAAKTFDDLPKKLVNRNLILTGRILANLENQRDYLTFDFEELVQNLASCKAGSGSFALNSPVFSATVLSVNPTGIDKALENIDFAGCWDSVGTDSKLEEILGTKGARDTGIQAAEKLKELSRWRNHLAHGGDNVDIPYVRLRDAIDFVAAFSTALDQTVKKHLKNAVKART
jgi:hypothetical protein